MADQKPGSTVVVDETEASAALRKFGADTWVLTGDIAA